MRASPTGRVRRFVLALAACLALGPVPGCTTRHEMGDDCLFGNDCVEPLVCAARRCRVSCRTSRDCLNGTVCRPSGEFALRVCLPPDDPWQCASREDCEAPQVCGPTRQCQAACRVDYDCRFVAFGARCADGLCHVDDAGAPDAPDAADDAPDVPAPSVDAPDAPAPDGPADVPAPPVDAPDAPAPVDATAPIDGPAPDAVPPPLDAPAPDARPDVGEPPTYSFLDVPTSEPRPAPPLRGFFGRSRVCAVRDDGRTFCWGPNPSGSLGVGASPDPVTAPTEVPALADAEEIAMASATTCARMRDGTVRCVGAGGGGQLGNGATASATVFAPVPGLAGVTSLRAGESHFCALLSDATMRCWGSNSYGQLGDGTSGNSRATPVTPRNVTGVAAFAVGESHTCARLLDGTARCWGLNNPGQVGIGSTTATVPSPTAVPGLANVTWITAGYRSSCALLADGSAWCWGSNSFQTLGDGTFTARTSPVRVMNLPPDVRAIETTGHATCVVHGAARGVSCFGMQPLGDGPASSAGSTAVPRPARGVSGVVDFTARAISITQNVFVARSPGGVILFWGNVGPGVLGPRAVSVGVPLAPELP